ncbi:MAG: AAA family ATPase [Bacteroidales bacterium]|nr:AAA family ATPase [Bacteroidales bacterium]MBR1577153.1 AAA family ATPase [Bacteroidales bacterium]
MDRAGFLEQQFLKHFPSEPTPCQARLFRDVGAFVTCDDADILVVNGYAGTGKTTAISAVIAALKELGTPSVLLAPTGRAAKVLAGISHRSAFTIHKHIYRQKSVGSDGFGQFSLAPNKAKGTLFVVDEVSLIGIDAQSSQGSTAFGTGNLLGDLVSFVRNGLDCRLILIGDAAQLPPVGLDASPALSKSFMDGFGGVRYSELTSVVRQAAESGILRNATHLREMIAGSYGDETFSDWKLDLRGVDDVVRIGGGELIETLSDAYGRYGEDGTVILCRSNKRAIRYNLGVRSTVQYKEERLVRGDALMIVKNCYQFVEDVPGMDYIANGDIAKLVRIGGYEDRYGLHFADATLSFPDYDDVELTAKVCLDTLESESASLTYDQQNALYQGVSADYADRGTKKKIWEAVREDPYFNALQLKYAEAITCHKSQGGQWDCVFIDCPFWQDEQTLDDLKWLYTALTRAVQKVYLVNFKDQFFI